MIRTISSLATLHPLLLSAPGFPRRETNQTRINLGIPSRLDCQRTYFKNKSGKLTKFRTRSLPCLQIVRHSTGRGVPSKAKAWGKTTIEVALDWYLNPIATCPNYVIDEKGTIYLVSDEALCPPHCGVDSWQRDMMLSGEWEHEVSEEAIGLWRRRFPDFKSPQYLFPSKSANWDAIGIEVIPLNSPKFPIFSNESYHALNLLQTDIAVRHGMNMSKKTTLLYHEDLDPFERWDAHGGTDPGALRAIPWFDERRIK